MSYFGTTDYLLEVSRGNVAGAVNIILRGHNTDLDSGGVFYDIEEIRNFNDQRESGLIIKGISIPQT